MQPKTKKYLTYALVGGGVLVGGFVVISILSKRANSGASATTSAPSDSTAPGTPTLNYYTSESSNYYPGASGGSSGGLPTINPYQGGIAQGPAMQPPEPVQSNILPGPVPARQVGHASGTLGSPINGVPIGSNDLQPVPAQRSITPPGPIGPAQRGPGGIGGINPYQGGIAQRIPPFRRRPTPHPVPAQRGPGGIGGINPYQGGIAQRGPGGYPGGPVPAQQPGPNGGPVPAWQPSPDWEPLGHAASR